VESELLFSQSEKPIGICADHAGFEMKSYLIQLFEEKGIVYKDFGTYSADSMDYADVAHPLASAVENGECYPGISICGSGNGINMTANKHQGIRSALCWTVEIASLARKHNDANMIALPGRFITNEEAYNILVAFLNTPFEGGRHQKRIEKIPTSC
jgi:ribose 5-phosphate isomerase B